MSKIKKRIKEKKKKTVSDYVLLSLFLLLLIFVIYLLFRLNAAKKEYNLTKGADFTIPVIEEKLNTISVDIGNKKKDEIVDYKFNITNYRDSDINKDKYKYRFYVNSEAKAEYTMTLKGDNKNILDMNNVSEYRTLISKKKDVKTYHLKIKLKEDQKKDSVVNLYIEGKK